jgi:hypothetical protein
MVGSLLQMWLKKENKAFCVILRDFKSNFNSCAMSRVGENRTFKKGEGDKYRFRTNI